MSAGEITRLESLGADGPGCSDAQLAQSESNLYSDIEAHSNANTDADSDYDDYTLENSWALKGVYGADSILL